jgi:hypothetical protein
MYSYSRGEAPNIVLSNDKIRTWRHVDSMYSGVVTKYMRDIAAWRTSSESTIKFQQKNLCFYPQELYLYGS